MNFYSLLRVCDAVWMGFVKLLLDTRGFGFYSRPVLGPSKWIMLISKANESSELQTPALDGDKCLGSKCLGLSARFTVQSTICCRQFQQYYNTYNSIIIKIVVCVKETFASCELSD